MKQESLADKVYHSVHQKIASGAIDPARKLTETELATLLGVSRTPVREALARLRREGLLDPTARKAVVSTLTSADIEEIMEVRQLMEPYVAGRAAERATPAGVARLEQALQEEERTEPLKQPRQFFIANHVFRQELLALAGNGRLAEAASRYDAQIQALRRATLTQPEHRKTVLKHHRALVAAIRAGDGVRAESTMRALMGAASDTMLALASSRRGRRA
ncbi:MAG TPA: GntR family transcriptional regulator [Ramlibacter sp.]|nr:GntR family transcriptional regulator [Ramlibacter sp.]